MRPGMGGLTWGRPGREPYCCLGHFLSLSSQIMDHGGVVMRCTYTVRAMPKGTPITCFDVEEGEGDT